MRVCYDGRDDRRGAWPAVDGAVLVDRFLENAIELDVDALCDGSRDLRRRGDGARRGGRRSTPATRRACCPRRPTTRACATLVRRLGPALGVVGLLNVQLAIARRRGLRARGQPARVADGAVRVQGDRRQPRRRGLPARRRRDARRPRPAARGAFPTGYHVKAAVLPFARFPGADPVLGPEMRSTGEVMASAGDFATGVRARPSAPPGGGCRPAARAFLTRARRATRSPCSPVAGALARARLRARRDRRHGERARRRRDRR